MKCKKATFASLWFAQFSVDKLNKKHENENKPLRAYLCSKCKLWHLTSMPDYEAQQKKIEALEEEILVLKSTNSDTGKRDRKEVAAAVRADARVVELTEMNKKQKGQIVNLRKTISDLIMRSHANANFETKHE